MIVLRARLRPHPDTGERRDVRAEDTSFDAARAQIDEQTPEGWVRLYIITGDEHPDSPPATAATS